MITLKRLEYFAKVAEQRNITRAAEQLHIAQPALGMHIRELEAAFGVTLLERHSRGVEPTAAGELLLERTAEIFELLERTRDDLRCVATSAPARFKLGMTTSIMQLIASDLLLSTQEHYPGVALQLHENPSFMLVDALVRREVDAILAYSVQPHPELTLTPVLKERVLFVTKAGEAGGGDWADMDEVLAHELVLGGERDVARQLVEQAALQKGVAARIKYETPSIAGQRDLILRGAAAAVLPMGAIARELRNGDVVARPIRDANMEMTLFVVRRAAADEVSRRHFATAGEILEEGVALLAARLGSLARQI
ncbi:MAG: LysR family transcriptional regulator [Pigmentiphaga sp.]|nr:LysR family transcriptional regulator [Pigmentiphaga sp.]